jgi:hypothetical protein
VLLGRKPSAIRNAERARALAETLSAVAPEDVSSRVVLATAIALVSTLEPPAAARASRAET